MDNSSDFIKKYEEFESKKLEPKVLATEVTRSGLDVCLVSFVKMAKHARGTKRRKGTEGEWQPRYSTWFTRTGNTTI
jgi:hypothetical protein